MKKIHLLFVLSLVFMISTNTQAQKSLQALISSTTNILCNGDSTGMATVTASRGTPPYTYLWLPDSSSSATDSNMVAGTYTVIVTDIANDTVILTVTLTQPPLLTLEITGLQNVTCVGYQNGSASVAASGGVPPYAYLWLPGGSINSSDSGMSPGIYTAQVIDSNGCTATINVTIG